MAATNELKIVLSAVDDASAALDKVRNRLKTMGDESDNAGGKTKSFSDRLQTALGGLTLLTAGAAVGVAKLTGEFNVSLDAANRYQNAILGLTSISRAFGQDSDRARAAAASLAKDGLMTVTEAAGGLKNLLASGFSLDQAIVLMNRFKDTASFNRQAALGFGEAIVSATEGIKNGNSILVDNAGITKNLSVILEEAGFSAQDLMKAQSDVNVRQAIYNGLLKESNPMVGDAARLSETFAGKQAMAAAQTTVLQQQLGTALQVALLPLLQVITPIITKVAEWIQNHQKLAAAIAIGITIFLGLLAVLGALAAVVAAVGAAIEALGAGIVAAIVVAAAAVAAGVAWIIVNFNTVKSFIGGLLAKFQDMPGPIRTAFAIAGGAVSLFLNPIGTLISSIQYLLNLAGNVRNAIGAIGNGAGLSGALHALHVPGFATGVRNFSGGLAVVGERGPELVSLPRGANVFSNEESRGMGGTVINQTNHIYRDIDLDEATARLAWGLANA